MLIWGQWLAKSSDTGTESTKLAGAQSFAAEEVGGPIKIWENQYYFLCNYVWNSKKLLKCIFGTVKLEQFLRCLLAYFY